MSAFKDPFDANTSLTRGCSCGRHGSEADHQADLAGQTTDSELLGNRVVEAAVMRALFPEDATRRRFLNAVGAGTAMAAISSLCPLGMAKEAFAQSGKLEKTSLKVGFIPITCATPIIMSQPM